MKIQIVGSGSAGMHFLRAAMELARLTRQFFHVPLNRVAA